MRMRHMRIKRFYYINFSLWPRKVV
jgi:hypothetical protein